MQSDVPVPLDATIHSDLGLPSDLTSSFGSGASDVTLRLGVTVQSDVAVQRGASVQSDATFRVDIAF